MEVKSSEFKVFECRQCGLIRNFENCPYECPQCHAEGSLHPTEPWKINLKKKSTRRKEIDAIECRNSPRICAQCGDITSLYRGKLISPPNKDFVVDQEFYCNNCRP